MFTKLFRSLKKMLSPRKWRRMDNVLKHDLIAKMMLASQRMGIVSYTSYGEREAYQDLMAMRRLLRICKVFEVPKEVATLLLKTKNVVRPTRLPFPIIFIDATITLPDIWHKTESGWLREETRYYGLLLAESGTYQLKTGEVIVPQPLDAPKPMIYIYSVFESERGGIGHIKFGLYKEYQHEMSRKEQKRWAKERRIIREYVMNFLDFLHDPEVEWVEVSKTYSKSKKSAKHGHGLKLPSHIVKVKGSLKRYLSQLKTGRHFTYSHRFWVRGHWRHLRHERFVNLRGQRIWIPPFIKGSGILITKRYKLIKGE